MYLIYDPPCQVFLMSLFCYTRRFVSSVLGAAQHDTVLAAGYTLGHLGAFCLVHWEVLFLIFLGYGIKEQPFEKGQEVTGKENETVSHVVPLLLF